MFCFSTTFQWLSNVNEQSLGEGEKNRVIVFILIGSFLLAEIWGEGYLVLLSFLSFVNRNKKLQNLISVIYLRSSAVPARRVEIGYWNLTLESSPWFFSQLINYTSWGGEWVNVLNVLDIQVLTLLGQGTALH